MIRSLQSLFNAFRHTPVGITALLCCCYCLSIADSHASPPPPQQRTVQGQVTSAEDRLGFPGVNIIVKGTAIGTVTDSEGRYTIEVGSPNDILVFSSIGYQTVEIPVGNQTTINLEMEVDVTQLEEVVVVGYGTVKKSDITGALVSISSDVIKERPVQNVLQALQGKAAGVHINSNFKPGELPVIRIRGNRSLERGRTRRGPSAALVGEDGWADRRRGDGERVVLRGTGGTALVGPDVGGPRAGVRLRAPSDRPRTGHLGRPRPAGTRLAALGGPRRRLVRRPTRRDRRGRASSGRRCVRAVAAPIGFAPFLGLD